MHEQCNHPPPALIAICNARILQPWCNWEQLQSKANRQAAVAQRAAAEADNVLRAGHAVGGSEEACNLHAADAALRAAAGAETFSSEVAAHADGVGDACCGGARSTAEHCESGAAAGSEASLATEAGGAAVDPRHRCSGGTASALCAGMQGVPEPTAACQPQPGGATGTQTRGAPPAVPAADAVRYHGTVPDIPVIADHNDVEHRVREVILEALTRRWPYKSQRDWCNLTTNPNESYNGAVATNGIDKGHPSVVQGHRLQQQVATSGI